MASSIAGIEFSVEFSDSEIFQSSYTHKSIPGGSVREHTIECFPFDREPCNELSYEPCGSPFKAMLNILIPSAVATTVDAEDIIQKLCCVGECRTDEENPTIQKSLTGQELSDIITNAENKSVPMYWGRIVRRLEPVRSENGTLYKLQFEFNSECALLFHSSNSEDQHIKPSSRKCFSLTLLILQYFSKQSVLSMENPTLLKNMLQNEIFCPIAYFDSPSFFSRRNEYEKYDTVPDIEMKGNEVDSTHSKFSEEDTSVLDRILSSAPYLQSRDDFLLATWLQSVHHSISSAVSVSSIDIGGLGFRYDTPAVYKDTTKTFLPLFTQLLPPRHFDTALPENNNLLSDKNELSPEDKEKIFYDMRRDAAVACLTGKLRVPIVTETAAMYVMTEIAKESIAKKKEEQSLYSTVGASESHQNLSSEHHVSDNFSEDKQSFANEKTSSENEPRSSHPSNLVHLGEGSSEIHESDENHFLNIIRDDKTSAAIDFLSMIAQYYVNSNDDPSKLNTGVKDIVAKNADKIRESDNEHFELPPPKKIKVSAD